MHTGLRVAELTGLRCQDAVLTTGPHLRCTGKGRKERATPLTSSAVATLRNWLAERGGSPGDPLFPSRRGTALSTDAVEALVAKHAQAAARRCPSIGAKNVTPHVLRHTCAMALRAAGIDVATIALWLGHEHIASVMPYMHADLGIKQQALDRTTPPSVPPGRYRPPDSLLAFLNSL